MLKKALIVLSLLLMAPPDPAFGFQDPKSEDVGVIAGTIKHPEKDEKVLSARVILLSARYAEIWGNEVQRRLDVYWERFKPAFAQRKDFFLEVSLMAHRDAMNDTIQRMRRDLRERFGNYVIETNEKGQFEFTKIPYGEYSLAALARVGTQDLLWVQTVEVTSPLPQFVELKKLVP